MRVSSPILPHLKDKHDETEVRKLALDLTDMINRANDGKFGNTSTGDYAGFESDGFLDFKGSAIAWADLMFSASALKGALDPPTSAIVVGGIYGWRFDAAKAADLQGSFEIQHDYKEGTDIDFHVHWSPTTTNTGNIVWGIEYSIAVLGATFPATTTITKLIAAPGVVNRHILTDVAKISGTGLKIGTVAIFRVYRQNGGTDTFTGNAFLHSLGVHYQVNTIGSRTELTK